MRRSKSKKEDVRMTIDIPCHKVARFSSSLLLFLPIWIFSLSKPHLLSLLEKVRSWQHINFLWVDAPGHTVPSCQHDFQTHSRYRSAKASR